MKIYPPPEEFSRLAATHNLIPIYTEISGDLETPVSLYLKLVGGQTGFMLESAESGRNFGRYSFIGYRPLAELAARAEQTELTGEQGEKTIIPGKPLDVLRRFLNAFKTPAFLAHAPFWGGGVGYFAYDLIAASERVRGYRLPPDHELMRLLFCRLVVIFDHLKHTLQFVYLISVPEPGRAQAAYEQGADELKAAVATVAAKRPPETENGGQTVGGKFSPLGQDPATARRYMNMVTKAKEYIAAGDAFQIVLSQEFTAPAPANPFNLYRRLRQVNPSPYMFYLNMGRKKLVGASPEMLVKVENGMVYTCPIAGTRPRGANEAEDQRLAAELLADEKERAEHAMLVDLGRNDIGRIAAPGSVRVERFMQVEKFSHVMHLVSHVSGKLDARYSALDALEACFPAGTVSGAPKVRAAEIIHELEGGCRGAYAGAVGYLDFRGNLDSCIAIRTLIIDGEQAVIRAGAGIVYDSAPEKEYQEVLHKGKALFKLLAEVGEDDLAFR